jgi:hypothetical protein
LNGIYGPALAVSGTLEERDETTRSGALRVSLQNIHYTAQAETTYTAKADDFICTQQVCRSAALI